MAWKIKVVEATPIDNVTTIRVRYEVTNDELPDLRFFWEHLFPASTSFDVMQQEVVNTTKDFIKRFEESVKVKQRLEGNTFTGAVKEDGTVELIDPQGTVY